MATVKELSRYIRSKNAGPFWITMDIFFNDEANYHTVKNSSNLNQEKIGSLYRVKPDSVKIFFVDNINVIKISIPREVPQGDAYERDMHGGQQYIELANLEV